MSNKTYSFGPGPQFVDYVDLLSPPGSKAEPLSSEFLLEMKKLAAVAYGAQSWKLTEREKAIICLGVEIAEASK